MRGQPLLTEVSSLCTRSPCLGLRCPQQHVELLLGALMNTVTASEHNMRTMHLL
jgi:hypothetical protein